MSQMAVHEFDPTSDILKDAGFKLPVVANDVFCTLTPPAGKYRIDINRIAYGSGSPSIANNSVFFVGSSDHVLSSAAALAVPYKYQFYVRLDGSTAIGVRALNNGSPNIGVTAGITATRLA